MKIILTLAEIKSLVCLRYGFEPEVVTVEVSIDPASLPWADRIISALRKGAGDENKSVFIANSEVISPALKISAIKALRETVPGLGLANAKKAVEDFEAFMRYVRSGGNPLNF